MSRARENADFFLTHERAFRLGMLPTEQSNPKTAGLAETAQRDLPAAIRMLQSVDADIVPVAERLFAAPEFARLVAAMRQAVDRGGRICFSGCGATGRLSVLLEASWRQFAQDLRRRAPTIAARLPDLADRVTSIMTGGDYAVVRSVENFEDHQAFGRRQVREAGLGPLDVLVAITEGGETSSVIGTVWQALQDGARAFFVFNNPARVLVEHIERSRQVIEDPRITKLDLNSGPMAVAGSTRMQATTSELLVVGAALETALVDTLRARLAADELAKCRIAPASAAENGRRFAQLLDALSRPESVAAIAAMVEYEEQIYRHKGLVTYLADASLLDIFTDTTERSPTFMLPRFRQRDDSVSPPSWAFVKNPRLSTAETWRQVLRRAPRCLEWDADVYRALDAPAVLQADPPRLGAGQMLKFLVGNEDDPSRYATPQNAAVLIVLGEEIARLAAPGAFAKEFRAAVQRAARPFASRAVLAIGPPPPDLFASNQGAAVWHVPLEIPASPLGLWDRLAAKLVLNTVSTATMARLGRLTSNWMVHVEPTNKKLIDRGTRLVAELTGVDYATACYALHETIEDLARTAKPGDERPSPVALTVARLQGRPLGPTPGGSQ